MECLQPVLSKLKKRGIKPELDQYSINWHNVENTACYIQLLNISCRGNDIAWFQSTEKDEYRLIVYQNDTLFEWEPKTYNSYFGCDCNLIEWIDDHLVFIYKEKHDTYICSVKDGQISYFNFHGNQLARKGNMIFFSGSEDGPTSIRRIKIPDLKEIEPAVREEVDAQGLILQVIFSPVQLMNNDK